MNVTNGGGELRNVVELAGLSWGVTIRASIECVGQRLVVREYMKVSTFQ